MATIMQKDVLIELNASARASIFHYKNKNELSEKKLDGINLEREFLVDLRNFFYQTNEKDLDFDYYVTLMKCIKERYVRNNVV